MLNWKPHRGPERLSSVRSRVQIKGVAEEAAGLVSLKHRMKQQPIRSVWDNNICQMKHFTGLAQYMPRFLLSENQPSCCKEMSAFGTVTQVKSSQGRGEDKGQRYSLVTNVLQLFPSIYSGLFSPVCPKSE